LTPAELSSGALPHPDAASSTTGYYEEFYQKCDKQLVDNALAFVVIHHYKGSATRTPQQRKRRLKHFMGKGTASFSTPEFDIEFVTVQ
jgi:hypothetical protein